MKSRDLAKNWDIELNGNEIHLYDIESYILYDTGKKEEDWLEWLACQCDTEVNKDNLIKYGKVLISENIELTKVAE